MLYTLEMTNTDESQIVLSPDIHQHGIQIHIHPSRNQQNGNTVLHNGPPLPDTGGYGIVPLASNETGGAGERQATSH
jgi:hypothetical protein